MLPGEALSGLISLLCLVAVPEPAQARPHRVDQVPNGQVFGCATCHVTTVGGDARNPFGQTVEAEFLSSVDESGDALWSPNLADRDSDGDGFTNGQELGDPDGLFDPGDPAGVTAPGDPADFPMTQTQVANPDLTGDGIVDDLDLIQLGEAVTDAYGDIADSSVDLDGDGTSDFDDILIILQNNGLLAEDASASVLPDLGPNDKALPALDLEAGNGVADGVMSVVVEGSDQTFEVEVFLDPLTAPASALELSFSFDSSLVAVDAFTGAGAIEEVYVRSNDKVVLVSTQGVTLGEGGYVGRIRFRSLIDITGIPVRIGLTAVLVAEQGTAFLNRLITSGVGVSVNPLDSVLPDLDGDGLVGDDDYALFTERFVLNAGQQDLGFDKSIDFDLDGVLTFEDVLLFALNLDRSVETFTFFRSSAPGPNDSVRAALDLDIGNEMDNSTRIGTFEGDLAVVSLEVFAHGVTSPLSAVEIAFDLDLSEVEIVAFFPAFDFDVLGMSSSGIVLGSLFGAEPADGYLGTVEVMSATDLAGVPTNIGVRSMILAESVSVLLNTAEPASLTLNEEVEAPPPLDIELVDIEIDSLAAEYGKWLVAEQGNHHVEMVLNAPLIDGLDDAGDPITIGSLPGFENFRTYVFPTTTQVENAVTSVDLERLIFDITLGLEGAVQVLGATFPEFDRQAAQSVTIGVGEPPAGEVAGTVLFASGLPTLEIAHSDPHVYLLASSPDSLLEGVSSEQTFAALSPATLRATYTSDDRQFQLNHVPDGSYYLFARIDALIDGERQVLVGVYGGDEASPIVVVEGGSLQGQTVTVDLDLPPIEISGHVTGAIEFEGDNLFVESDAGDLIEVLLGETFLSNFEGVPFEDITLVVRGDSIEVRGDLLGFDRIRATTIVADVELEPVIRSSDFTGDGQVDFSDFVLFAMSFGSVEGTVDFEPGFDLDRDGSVSFSDFLLFVQAFG